MAISMVRKPSETPNITNIDDIIPFRYAYGNQCGYVIGRGAEVSYTVNGNQFTINSGRLVIQGVESDIDANGVTLTIDSVSETRYYVVYYEINLATNTANIKLSNYSTTGYPTVSVGDDLTVNTSGTARLPLYRFTSTAGVIGNIEKVVSKIKYVKDIVVEDSKKVNGMTVTKDDNNVLKIDNIVVVQKRLLGKNETPAKEIMLPVSPNGNNYEIIYTVRDINQHIICRTSTNSVSQTDTPLFVRSIEGNRFYVYASISIYANGAVDINGYKIDINTGSSSNVNDLFKIVAVYEIIE